MQLYIGIWKCMDGEYAQGPILYRSEEHAKADLGKAFIKVIPLIEVLDRPASVPTPPQQEATKIKNKLLRQIAQDRKRMAK